ncbi:MAG: polysialyltransferase family glycosyltransferase, partial [Desulfobacteraceae bacterium]|nr:polysialyltransferase family glycosyltransferase [Desulfobacteraceae bacterium]
MIKLFICSTPYHVLLSHLTVEFLSQDEKIHNTTLILILTESAISNVVNLIIDQSIWHKILILPYHKTLNLYKTKRFIDNWINDKGLNKLSEKKEIFINDDKRWRNQLLITGIKPDGISLIEDGIGAYIRSFYHLRERIYRGLILKSIFRSRLINIGTISSLHADRFFAFRNTAYSWFGPHRKLHLLEYKNSGYIEKISQKSFIKNQKEKIDSTNLLILTSPLVEENFLSIKDECNAWKKLGLYLPYSETVVIKPHPRENEFLFKQRLNVIAEVFKKSRIVKVDSMLPAEILLCNDDIQAEIFSPNSTTLANLKSIRPDLKIYHGYDLFFSNKITKNSMKKAAI